MKRFAEYEDTFIRNNWKVSTDSDIGRTLSREAESIKKRRKILGLKKRRGSRLALPPNMLPNI